ncbi:hypothetical protein [Planctomycetes bacterium CA13]
MCVVLGLFFVTGCGGGEVAPNATTNEIQSYLEENPDVAMRADDEPPEEQEQFEMSDAME